MPGRRQGGQSLIAIMIGLVIAMLTIAAMLAIYKVMIEVSGAATTDAQRDGQVASGLLTAQIEVQQAGFGVVYPDNALPQWPAFLEADDPLISQRIAVGDDGRRVVWHYRLQNASHAWEPWCAGLEVQADGEQGARMHALAPKSCSDAAAVAEDDDWERTALVSYAGLWKDRAGNAVAAGAGLSLSGAPAFSIDESAECMLPYAQQMPDPAFANPVARPLVLRDGDLELFSTCLSNVVVATTVPVVPDPDGAQGGSP